MKILLETSLGEAIMGCADEVEGDPSSALSCEAGKLTPKRAKELVLAALHAWDQRVLIMFRRVGVGKRESVRVYLIDMAELAAVVDEALESEEVISIRDPGANGGCTFDLSPEESPQEQGAIELLLTAWGIHEKTVERLAEKLGVETFRQGPTLRLYR